MPGSLSLAELQAELLMPVMTGCAPKPALAQAVFTLSRGQVPAERNFLDFLGQYMQVERVRETGRTPLGDNS